MGSKSVGNDLGYALKSGLADVGKSLADLVGLTATSEGLEEFQKRELEKATTKILQAKGKSKAEIEQAIAMAKASIQPLLNSKFSGLNQRVSSLLTKIQDKLDSTKLAITQSKSAVPGIKRQYRDDLRKQTALRDEAEGLAEKLSQQQNKAQTYGAAYDALSERSKMAALTNPDSSTGQLAKMATGAADDAMSQDNLNKIEDIERRLS